MRLLNVYGANRVYFLSDKVSPRATMIVFIDKTSYSAKACANT